MNAHVDVAAYALGAMDDREASQFEDHLVGCATCTAELESMVSVVALLADVTLEDVTGEAPVGPYTAATGIPIGGQLPVQPQTPPVPQMPPAPQMPQAPQVPQMPPAAQMPQMPQGPMLTPLPGAPGPDPFEGGPSDPYGESPDAYGGYGGPMLVPGSEDQRSDRPRREDRSRRDDRRDDRRTAVPSPATGPVPISRRRQGRPRRTVLLAAAAAVVGAVGGGAAVAESGYFQEKTPAPVVADDSIIAPGQQAGGETFTNTDKKTGAYVEAQLVSRPWGTNVGFTVTKVKGPKACRLVAVRADGETEVLSTWTVPDGGYGFPERPQPLKLVAATSLKADEMESLKVQEMESNGDVSTLVTVRV